MLTSKQRAALRGAANPLEPVFQIGKGDIDEALVQALEDCIAARELIKVKVLETRACEPRDAAVLLAERLPAACVPVSGRKFVFFRQ